MPLTARDHRATGRVSLPLWYQPSGTQGAWEEIARSVLGSAAASISFQGIDARYKLFRVEFFQVNDASAGGCELTLNNDGGANYDIQRLVYNDTTSNSGRDTGQTQVTAGPGTSASDTALYEFVFGKPLAGNEATGIQRVSPIVSSAIRIQVAGFVWNNTADLINRVDLTKASAGNFDAGSVAVLYGNRT